MNRRVGLMAGVALAAGAAGLGAAWWQRRSGAGSGSGSGSAVNDIRTASFPRPGGGALRLTEFDGQMLLLNFWATWCPPCVTELPLLESFHRDLAARGWRVVGLAVDQGPAVAQFLSRHPVSFPIGLAGLEGIGWSRRLGNTTGALPFTVVFDRKGLAVDRKLGAITPEDLAAWRVRAG